jgi:hypothetical protein
MPLQRGQAMLVDSPIEGPQALPRQLQQAEARETPDLDARAVLAHGIAQPVFDGALVLLRLHVDEVDDDQAAEVAQPQLTGDLVAASRLVLSAVVSMSLPRGRARRVDVDRHQRLGRIDDDRAAGGQVDLVGVRRLDLVLDLEAREQRHAVLVQLQLAQARGHEALHVLLRSLNDFLVVDQDFADVVGEVVAQRADDGLRLLIDQERRRAAFGGG